MQEIIEKLLVLGSVEQVALEVCIEADVAHQDSVLQISGQHGWSQEPGSSLVGLVVSPGSFSFCCDWDFIQVLLQNGQHT